MQNYGTMRMKQEIAGGFLLFLYSAADVAEGLPDTAAAAKSATAWKEGAD